MEKKKKENEKSFNVQKVLDTCRKEGFVPYPQICLKDGLEEELTKLEKRVISFVIQEYLDCAIVTVPVEKDKK